MRYFALVLLLLLIGCSPNSKEDFQHQGEAICRELVEKLKKIETREELVEAVPVLTRKFDELVELIIEARTFQQKKEEEFDVMPEASENSLQLLNELKRIYKIEAGREMIEKAQKEALLKLDAYENRRKKSQTLEKPKAASAKERSNFSR